MLLFISSLDHAVAAAIPGLRTPQFTVLFSIVTFFGSTVFIAFAALAVAVVLWRSERREWALPFLAAVIGSAGTTYALKFIVQRLRPPGGLVAETSFAFPSGHATAGAAFYGFLIFMCWRTLRKKSHKFVAVGFGLFFVAAVGFSRLYLGVHYVSDVIAGYAVGLVWIFISSFLYEKRK